MSARVVITAIAAGLALVSGACTNSLPPAPSEIRIDPPIGPIDTEIPVTIRAKNLSQFAKTDFSAPTSSELRLGFRITVGGFDLLEQELIERDTVSAKMPRFTDPATLDVIIEDIYGRETVAPGAFTVRTLTCADADSADGTDCEACEDMPGCACNAENRCVTVCGDGVARDLENCDDDNTTDNDGCSATCTIEQGYACDGTPSVCSPICSDGMVVGSEICDDMNQIAGDGCSGSCTEEPGWTCTSSAGGPSTCVIRCGDGIRFPEEPCDDGDLENGDGCSSTCVVEDGYVCTGSPSVCAGLCGDGLLVGELCDDGDRESGDGCDENCRPELGFDCSGAPSICLPRCGDGFVRGGEACDDGDLDNDDGCSGACTVEPNWDCIGEPSICTGECGDGEIRGPEPCDDGNNVDLDGCSALCEIEEGYICPTAGMACIAVCGDRLVRGGEGCDDGNTVSLDGCTDVCAVELGYVCPVEGQLCIPRCGDGMLIGGEPCDDGNPNSGDGCSATCTIEQGYSCPTPGQLCSTVCGDGFLRGLESCDDNNTTTGDGCTAACTIENGYTCPTPGQLCAAICGDGLLRGAEACDDDNLTAADGCSPTCTIEQGYTCPTPGQLCEPICGDGLLRGTEACDDGNLNSTDGCSFTCTIEQGYTCPTPGQPCVPICGDGLLRGTEVCDDGNTGSLDGCSATCTVEQGFVCGAPGQACTPICGDGLRVSGEGCDDGNTLINDGCSATCAVEAGYTCPIAGQPCDPVCGDGLLRGGEECDDGDSTGGDGCGAFCRVEPTYVCAGAPSVCTPGVCAAAQRINVSSSEVQGNNITAQFGTDLTDNGQLIAFASLADNLVAGDANNVWDVFVRDVVTGSTEVISISSAGVFGNGDSGSIGVTPPGTALQEVAINADGRYVAFISRATNLVAGDTNNIADVFLRDRTSGTTERISVSSAGVEAIADGMGRGADNVAISADGRFVAFTSWSPNLVADDTNNNSDVFVRDRLSGSTELVSISAITGQGSPGATILSAISADGRYVVFSGNISLVVGVLGGVYLRDRVAGTTEAVSRASGPNGAPANGGCCAEISGDGRFVMFSSQSAGLVPVDANNVDDVFVRDRVLATTVRASVDGNGVEGALLTRYASMSDDGRFVVLQTANAFDPVNDANAFNDVYVKDLLTQAIVLLSRGGVSGPAGDNDSVRPRISKNGWFVIFESDATTLLPPDTNASDLYRSANCP